jgi:hypothetical protein
MLQAFNISLALILASDYLKKSTDFENINANSMDVHMPFRTSQQWKKVRFIYHTVYFKMTPFFPVACSGVDKKKFALEQAMKAQRENRGIALLFL